MDHYDSNSSSLPNLDMNFNFWRDHSNEAQNIQISGINSFLFMQNFFEVFKSSPENQELKVEPSKVTSRKCTKRDRSKRKDVVIKTLLRSIRRYYLRLFKTQNPKLVRRRIVNVQPKQLRLSLEALCKDILGEKSANTNLVVFMQTILNLKPPHNIQDHKQSVMRGSEFLS